MRVPKCLPPNFSQDDEKEDAKYVKIDLPASFQRIWHMSSFKTECISEPTPRQMNYGELAGQGYFILDKRRKSH
jgi:hypothetical protein